MRILLLLFFSIFFGVKLLKYYLEGIIASVVVIVFVDAFIVGFLLLNIPLKRKCEAFVADYLKNLEKLYPMIQ